MMNKSELKKWVQLRIDYWEGICGLHNRLVPEELNINQAYEFGYEEGEEHGVLEGLYQVMEYIDGQRK